MSGMIPSTSGTLIHFMFTVILWDLDYLSNERTEAQKSVICPKVAQFLSVVYSRYIARLSGSITYALADQPIQPYFLILALLKLHPQPYLHGLSFEVQHSLWILSFRPSSFGTSVLSTSSPFSEVHLRSYIHPELSLTPLKGSSFCFHQY